MAGRFPQHTTPARVYRSCTKEAIQAFCAQHGLRVVGFHSIQAGEHYITWDKARYERGGISREDCLAVRGPSMQSYDLAVGMYHRLIVERRDGKPTHAIDPAYQKRR